MLEKMFKPLISQALANLGDIDTFITGKLEEIKLQDGEKRTAFIIIKGKLGARLLTTALNEENEVVRIIRNDKLTDFVKELINNNK